MRNILLVEDDTVTRQYLSFLLEEKGYSVRQAENGRQALAGLDADGQPELVIVDIFMPEMDGIEIIIHFKESGISCPILAISGGGSDGDLTYLGYAKSLGACETLEKPFADEEFLDTVNNVFARQATQ